MKFIALNAFHLKKTNKISQTQRKWKRRNYKDQCGNFEIDNQISMNPKVDFLK